MALSLAQRHRLQALASQEAAAASPAVSMAGGTAYEMQLAQLLQDRLRLKQIQSNEGKAALKLQLLPAYVPYVDGVLAAGINLNEFVERAAEHRQKLADVSELRDRLKESRCRKFLESNKAVDSAVRAYQAARSNNTITKSPTVKCWMFQA